MLFVDHDHMIRALAPDRPNQAFNIWYQECEEIDDKAKRKERDRPSVNIVDVARAVEARSVGDAKPKFQLQVAVAT